MRTWPWLKQSPYTFLESRALPLQGKPLRPAEFITPARQETDKTIPACLPFASPEPATCLPRKFSASVDSYNFLFPLRGKKKRQTSQGLLSKSNIKSFLLENRLCTFEFFRRQFTTLPGCLLSILCDDKGIFLFHNTDRLDFIITVTHLG